MSSSSEKSEKSEEESGLDLASIRLIGGLSIAAAALLWSSSSLFAKSTIFHDWPVNSRGVLLAFWRALFAGALLLPAVRRPRWNPRIVPMTLCFATMNVTFLASMTLTTAANTIWLQSTAPFWVFLFGVVWLREPIVRANMFALAFGLGGIGIILTYEMAGEARTGILCGLVSGLAYAGVALFLRVLRDQNGAWLVVLNHLVAALVLLPFVIYENKWPSPTQLAVLAAFGFFQMGLPYVLFARGLRTLATQEASIIALLEPLLVPLWAFLVIHEVPAIWTVAGSTCIMAGLLIRLGYAYVATRRKRTVTNE